MLPIQQIADRCPWQVPVSMDGFYSTSGTGGIMSFHIIAIPMPPTVKSISAGWIRNWRERTELAPWLISSAGVPEAVLIAREKTFAHSHP
jgi:hypothetical protein